MVQRSGENKFSRRIGVLDNWKKKNMLKNNVTRNKMGTISYRHEGVVDLIC
jgi:hypothetical protein